MPQSKDRTDFFARIAAGATHEIRNVLAAIKESAGLVDDLARLSERDGRLDRDTILRATERVHKQVVRGTELISSLNRFAHSLDRTDGPVDLKEQLYHFDMLNQRFARQKSCRLAVQEGEGIAGTSIESFELQMALSAALEYAIGLLPGGGAITVSPGADSGRAHVAFAVQAAGPTPGGPPEAGIPGLVEISATLADLRVELEPGVSSGEFRLRLPEATG